MEATMSRMGGLARRVFRLPGFVPMPVVCRRLWYGEIWAKDIKDSVMRIGGKNEKCSFLKECFGSLINIWLIASVVLFTLFYLSLCQSISLLMIQLLSASPFTGGHALLDCVTCAIGFIVRWNLCNSGKATEECLYRAYWHIFLSSYCYAFILYFRFIALSRTWW